MIVGFTGSRGYQRPELEGSFKCGICRKHKPQQEFHIDKSRTPPIQRACKPCKLDDNQRAVLRYAENLPDPDTTTQACKACGEEKLLRDFPKHKFYKTGRFTRCKSCLAVEQSRRRVKYDYGITEDDYYRLVQEQGGRCLICGRDPTTFVAAAKPRRKLHIDHIAGTKTVCGLLCADCNSAIGMFAHDPCRALGASAYLLGRGAR